MKKLIIFCMAIIMSFSAIVVAKADTYSYSGTYDCTQTYKAFTTGAKLGSTNFTTYYVKLKDTCYSLTYHNAPTTKTYRYSAPYSTTSHDVIGDYIAVYNNSTEYNIEIDAGLHTQYQVQLRIKNAHYHEHSSITYVRMETEGEYRAVL